MTDIDGKTVTRADLHGRVAVIYTWTTLWQYDSPTYPLLNSLSQKYASSEKAVFWAITSDKAEKVKSSLQQNPFSFRHFPNETLTPNKLGILYLPTLLVVDAKGEVRLLSTQPTIEQVQGLDRILSWLLPQ